MTLARITGCMVVAALAAAAVPPSATAEQIATLERATPVRAHADALAWSTWDAAASVFRLTLRRDGRTEILAAVPRTVPFDADLGTDARGRLLLVYSRCITEEAAAVAPRYGGCDLFSYSPTDGRERRLHGASSAEADETRPTLWRGRLVWVRRYYRRFEHPLVYTRKVTSARTVASRRLPGVPTGRCSELAPDRGCNPTADRSIPALELYGSHLAQVVRYTYPGGVGHSTTELRLVDLRGGVRIVRVLNTGEGGQTFVGPSFTHGRLGFAISCFGDPGGCRHGAHRYRLRDGRLERTVEGKGLDGFAIAGTTGERAYVLDTVATHEAGPEEGPFVLEGRVLSGWAPVPRR